jgi:hypothetical protein
MDIGDIILQSGHLGTSWLFRGDKPPVTGRLTKPPGGWPAMRYNDPQDLRHAQYDEIFGAGAGTNFFGYVAVEDWFPEPEVAAELGIDFNQAAGPNGEVSPYQLAETYCRFCAQDFGGVVIRPRNVAARRSRSGVPPPPISPPPPVPPPSEPPPATPPRAPAPAPSVCFDFDDAAAEIAAALVPLAKVTLRVVARLIRSAIAPLLLALAAGAAAQPACVPSPGLASVDLAQRVRWADDAAPRELHTVLQLLGALPTEDLLGLARDVSAGVRCASPAPPPPDPGSVPAAEIKAWVLEVLRGSSLRFFVHALPAEAVRYSYLRAAEVSRGKPVFSFH